MIGSGAKRNLAANFIGKAWLAIISLVFVPVYIKLLGIQAYGLIGVYTSLLALLGVLDMGLSTTVNRELARLSALREAEQSSRDLVRTLETVYWGATLLISMGCIASSHWIAHHWIHAQSLSSYVVMQAFVLMGLVLAFQWPESFYVGGLVGLQQQVLLNGLSAIRATCLSIGAVLILRYVSHTIQAYFVWQALVSAVFTLTLRHYVWKALPITGRTAGFRTQVLRECWRLALGVAGITLMSTIITQLDKAVLSKLLTLEMFAYYALAAQIANALSYFVDPVFAAAFPRFSQLFAAEKPAELARLYHKTCQLLAAVICSIGIVLIVFGRELWTRYFHNSITADHIKPLLDLMIVSVVFQSIMRLPFGLQLAANWTALSFWKTFAAAICFVPLLFWMVGRFGVTGAAAVRLIIYGSYILIEIPLMHRRLLRGEMWRWYLLDLALPVAISACIGVFIRTIVLGHAPSPVVLLWIPLTLGLMMSVSGILFVATQRYVALRRA